MVKKPTTAAAPAAAPVAAVSGRVAPDLTAATAAVKMPEPTATRRGSKSPYPFAALTAAGMSFGIKNKTAKNMASIVSNQNRKAMVAKKDEAGNPVFKTQEMKDAAGNVTHVPTEEIEKIATKHFFAADCDPKTDPDGATVRVFRDV